MPVTARLSKQFYDRFGEQVTNELVDWFNQVDATYRADLRELNELNFARFDAKVEQRFAQFDAKLEQRLAQADVRLEQRFTQSDAAAAKQFVDVRVVFADRLNDQSKQLTRLMIALWTTLMIPIIGLWVR